MVGIFLLSTTANILLLRTINLAIRKSSGEGLYENKIGLNVGHTLWGWLRYVADFFSRRDDFSSWGFYYLSGGVYGRDKTINETIISDIINDGCKWKVLHPENEKFNWNCSGKIYFCTGYVSLKSKIKLHNKICKVLFKSLLPRGYFVNPHLIIFFRGHALHINRTQRKICIEALLKVFDFWSSFINSKQ